MQAKCTVQILPSQDCDRSQIPDTLEISSYWDGSSLDVELISNQKRGQLIVGGMARFIALDASGCSIQFRDVELIQLLDADGKAVKSWDGFVRLKRSELLQVKHDQMEYNLICVSGSKHEPWPTLQTTLTVVCILLFIGTVSMHLSSTLLAPSYDAEEAQESSASIEVIWADSIQEHPALP